MRRILRWISRLLTITSTVALIAFGGLWIRGCHEDTYVRYSSESNSTGMWISRGQVCVFRDLQTLRPDPSPVPESELGRFTIVCYFIPSATLFLANSMVTSDAEEFRQRLAGSPHGFLCFRQLRETPTSNRMIRSVARTAVAAPLWAPVSTLSILPAIAVFRRLPRRARTGNRPASPPAPLGHHLARLVISATCGLSAAVLLLLIATWISSIWVGYLFVGQAIPRPKDMQGETSGEAPPQEGTSWYFQTSTNCLTFTCIIPEARPPIGAYLIWMDQRDAAPVADELEHIHQPVFRFLGFKTYLVTSNPSDTPESRRAIFLPYWMPLISAAILPSLWLLSWRRCARAARRAATGLCPHCGYDLRASPDRCPECGMAVPAESTGRQCTDEV